MENPQDKITLDVPLFIRLLEYAREDAKTDMDLHDVTERVISMSGNEETLTMDNYHAIVGGEATGGEQDASMEEDQELGRLRSLAGL